MARLTPNQPPPNTATPGDQALVTPSNRPDVLLAVQHTQAMQTLHNECANIRQELGGVQAEIALLKAEKMRLIEELGQLKDLRNQIIGGLVVLGAVIGVAWFFVAPTWSTLQTMASEYQVHKADKAEHERIHKEAAGNGH